MRIEILVLAALAAFASAAPQWPYRDAVAPYYYGYPGKTPYMYRSGDEDDEMDESYLARQDLKVAPSKDAAAGSSVTVVEDDEKADGVRVVETGSAKPVAQIGSSSTNNRQQQEQSAAAAAASPSAAQAQQPQPLNNNAQQAANNGQPLTVQQPGQQPPQAFPPARPTTRPRPPTEEDEDEEDEEDSEEDEAEDADAEDEEDGDDDDDEEEDEEEEDDRKRNENVNANNNPSSTSESEEPQQVSNINQQEQAQSSISEESVQEEQPTVVVQPVVQSQSAVLNNKISKSKQKISNNNNVAPVVPITGGGKNKRVQPAAVAIGQNKNNKNPGAIEALVPGYVTDQGEVLVPVDTVTGSQPITIVPDPFSPPSRIVSGPRPIPQSAVPQTPNRQVPYWYRSSPAISPFQQDPSPPRQTLYSSVPPPGSIFTFDDDDDDDDEDTPQVIPTGNRLRQGEPPFYIQHRAQKPTKFYYRPLFDY